MTATRMSWLYHASTDPYNTTEFMDWAWSDLIMDWTNGKHLCILGNACLICRLLLRGCLFMTATRMSWLYHVHQLILITQLVYGLGMVGFDYGLEK